MPSIVRSICSVVLVVILIPFAGCREVSQPALDDSGAPKTLFPTEKNDQWGYVTRDGEIAIKPQFERAHRFVNNRALVRQNDSYGYIDTSGATIISPRFTAAKSFSEGFAPVRTDSLWGYVNREGDIVIRPRFVRAEPFREGFAEVQLPSGDTGYLLPNDSLARPAQ